MLLQFKRQQDKDDQLAICKTTDAATSDRQDFLHSINSQLDFLTATAGPICNAISKDSRVCDEADDHNCATHSSCFVKVFRDRSKGDKLSACFCPSSTDPTASRCVVEKPGSSSSTQDQSTASSGDATSSTSSSSNESSSAGGPTVGGESTTTPTASGSESRSSSSTSKSSDVGGSSPLTDPTTSIYPPDPSSAAGAPATTLSTHFSSSRNSIPVGAIVGAIVGGLVLLLLVGALLFYRRRKRKSQIPPSAEFLERGYGTRTPQPALFDGQRDSAAELLPDYDRGAAVNPPFEKEQEIVVASPDGYGVGHGLNKRQ